MKRIFTFILALVTGAGTVFAESGTWGNLTWNLTDGTLTINGTGVMWDQDAYPWGEFSASVQSLVVEDGITAIGQSAFYAFTNLSSVTLANSVIAVGGWAFDGCSSLSSLSAEGLEDIGYSAFSECGSLTSLSLPACITVGEYAFMSCVSLASVALGTNVTTIGEAAFFGCESIASFTCEAVFPPQCGENCFVAVDMFNVPLYVPTESVEVYGEHDGWSGFAHILPIGSSVTPEEPGVEKALSVVPMTGEEQQYALSLIGRITFDEDNMYLLDLQGEVLGEQPLASVRKIVFCDAEQTPTSLSQPLSHVRAYPVPARDILIVEGVEGSDMVRVYSMQGAFMMSAPVSEGRAQVQVAELPQGDYLLQAGVEIIKFIKK